MKTSSRNRRSIRLKGHDYSQAGLYFVTICTENRQHLFGEIVNGKMGLNEYGNIVQQCWQEIPTHYPDTILHEFIVMPNHIHGIIQIINCKTIVGVENFRPLHDVKRTSVGAENFPPLHQHPNCKPRTIGAMVRGFKIGTTKQLGKSIWQRNYHEHIIRNNHSHEYIANYIVNNPKTWESDSLNSACLIRLYFRKVSESNG